jgi:hypothetical protein
MPSRSPALGKAFVASQAAAPPVSRLRPPLGRLFAGWCGTPFLGGWIEASLS